MNKFKTSNLLFYKIIWLSTFLLLSNLIGGCSLFDSNEKERFSEAIKNFSLETDQDVYQVNEDGFLEITYVYVNKGDQVFYPGSCLGVASENLQKLVDEEWIPAYSPFCQYILRTPIKVEPGKTYEATIQLHSSTWDSTRNNASWNGGEIEGTYRVWERVYGGWSIEKYDSGTLQSEIVVSNAFEIRKES
ncbi:MAG: hypothetical protein SVR94_17080 [Pseudomonadota bacterium]|nr:hypothetical protein [Pseudomonadota bacterium]